jgi:hypothetical protein
MGDVARAGRTVVLVSHQMNQIRRLSHRVVWVDEGRIRMDGDPHQVLAAYESLMASGDRGVEAKRNPSSKVQFRSWEIASPRGEQPQVLSTLGPTTIRFVLEVSQPVSDGEHGVALFNSERQLMWAQAIPNLNLAQGVQGFSLAFETLPLRPGVYQWQVSLWEGGEILDLWDCLPEMIIATDTNQHYRDEWNGILNLSATFACTARGNDTLERATHI